jgi:hypothetical protein
MFYKVSATTSLRPVSKNIIIKNKQTNLVSGTTEPNQNRKEQKPFAGAFMPHLFVNYPLQELIC